VNDADSTHESFIRLLLRHEPSVRAVIRSVVHRAEDVDEVMQAVSLVAWRKFASLTDREGFGRWACVIARYEILKFLRSRARERFVLDPGLVERILAEGEEETEGRGRRLSLLERCLEKLPETRRELLLQVYTPGGTVRELAGRLGRSEDALYQMLRRLRLELRDCVESGMVADGGIS
jgi:RNA polymerase sigma-70 factor (ECF subfamily)